MTMPSSLALQRPDQRGPSVLAASLLACAGLTGVVVGSGRMAVALGLVAMAAVATSGLLDWRWPLYGLLLYLPFSGIPFVLLYPNVRLVALLKDVLFVLPAYGGFLLHQVACRERTELRVVPALPIAFLTGLVVVHAFNPGVHDRLLGAIGAKVWLFYIPLAVLGYHLVRERRDLARLLCLMGLLAVVPALVGVAEATLVYVGHPELVYRWYGEAAGPMTQDFAVLYLAGDASLRRIPSTFPFVTQYFGFTASMAAVAYAWWRGVAEGTRAASLARLVWVLVVLAGLLSGARAAFVFIPLMMLLVMLLERGSLHLSFGRTVVPYLALLLAAAALIGTSAGGLLGHVAEVGRKEFASVFVGGFHSGFGTTLAGLGTGVDTSAARYAFARSGQFDAVATTWSESWYVKAHLELGLAGLVAVVVLLGHLAVTAVRRHAALRDPHLRAISAALVAFLLSNLLWAVKGQYLDMDPINVYFWLFVGVLARLPQLDQGELAPRAGVGS